MRVSRAIRLLVSIAFLASCSTITKPPTAAQPHFGPSGLTADRMVDSIPPPLFQKMFRGHRLVGSPGLAWKRQRVVTVAFNGGSDDIYELIEQTANEWTALGGQLSFSFKDDAGQYRHWSAADTLPVANIRIAFEGAGYWSLLGVLAKNVDPGDPTMNFGDFPTKLTRYIHGKNADEWRTSYAHSTILHEFGHAIGLSHEHFTPQCQKDLMMDSIIAYLMAPPNDWPQEQARFNMDAQYYAKILAKQAGPLESKLFMSSSTDQSSVMLYVFPATFYKSGDASACKPVGDHGQDWPTTLSEGDKRFYLANYGSIQSPFGPAASLVDDSTSEAGLCDDQISYDSDTDDAYKYLENQQRAIYKENPHIADPFARAELESPRSISTWAELKSRALKACPDPSLRAKCALDPEMVDRLMRSMSCLRLPTRFEAPLFASLINLYTDRLDRVRLAHFPASGMARFGSLPTGVFDAQAILPPGSKTSLVILNRDIFYFTGALSKAIADAIPITVGRYVTLEHSEPAIRRRLREYPYIVHNFADAMSRLVRDGSSAGAIEVTLDENHNRLHARLVGAMDGFLISHEVAHVILGHVSDQSVAFRLAGGHSGTAPSHVSMLNARNAIAQPKELQTEDDQPSTALKAELRTREQELEADALGFKLLIWLEEADGDPISEMIAGAAPHMVFRVLEAASRYGSEAGLWTFSDASHPSAADRVRALSPVFDEVAKEAELLRQADFREPFDAAFRVLLAEADPQIRKELGLARRRSLR